MAFSPNGYFGFEMDADAPHSHPTQPLRQSTGLRPWIRRIKTATTAKTSKM
jgi:hypothetical protein